MAADVVLAGRWKARTPEWRDVEHQFEVVERTFGEYFRVGVKGCPEKQKSARMVDRSSRPGF